MSEEKSSLQDLLSRLLPYVSGGIGLFRLCVFTVILYGLLIMTASWAIRNIQSEEGSEQTAFTKVSQFQELDRSYWDAFVSASICQNTTNCSPEQEPTLQPDDVLTNVELFKSLNRRLEATYTKMLEKEQAEVFTTEFKSSDLSSAEIAANPIYINSILSFKQGLKLLWASGLVLIFLLAGMSLIRNIEEQYETTGYYLKYVGGLLLVVLAVFSLLPQVYFSTFLRPGQELLSAGFQTNEGVGPTVMFLFDVLFVISFAGIVSQFGLEQLLQKTPEENMIHLRDGFPWGKAYALGMARSAERLTSMMPFLLTATLFANARMSRGDGIYKLVQEVFRVAEAPGQALQALILTTLIVVSLNTLGKRLMIAVQEMLYTIPASKEIR